MPRDSGLSTLENSSPLISKKVLCRKNVFLTLVTSIVRLVLARLSRTAFFVEGDHLAVRIGLAFNLKPEAPANPAGANSESPSSDEPPSRALRPDLSQPDLYAEWDEPATINAVERALSTVGQVYRLEANSSFPARLALLRPDFVFNIAEGLYGPSRRRTSLQSASSSGSRITPLIHSPAVSRYTRVEPRRSSPITACPPRLS